MIVRILIWSLFDSGTTIDELRESLAALEPPSTWIWNDASERFGIVAVGEELPEAVAWVRDLIGGDPEVYEEFDVLAALCTMSSDRSVTSSGATRATRRAPRALPS